MDAVQRRPGYEAVISPLQTALQAVSNPATYLPTGESLLPAHRAALAERAKAMTGLMLFMMEGLVRARLRLRDKGICDVPSMVHAAWLRYLQLHDREAGLIVPMDGWLIAAFPRSLLTQDKLVLDILAASTSLGNTDQASSSLSLPKPFLMPAQLFGHLIEQPTLAAEIGALLTSGELTIADNIQGWLLKPNADPIAQMILGDFATALLDASKLDRTYSH